MLPERGEMHTPVECKSKERVIEKEGEEEEEEEEVGGGTVGDVFDGRGF